MEHKLSIAFGVSNITYGQDHIVPIHGLGQGNGAASSAWAVISTPMINMMRTAGLGFSMLTALSMTLVHFVCYAFVDDTDFIHSAWTTEITGKTTRKEMQTVTDTWEGGLGAIGDAIVPAKSYWYLLGYIWSGKRWKYKTKEDLPGKLTIYDAHIHEQIPLERLYAKVANETLGVWLAMDGNNETQIKVLRQKTENGLKN